jgi:ATP-binding cassette subfamily F protein 2
VALEGPNSAGNSTVLLTGELLPEVGMSWKHFHVTIGHHHLQEQLVLNLSPLEDMMKCYPEIKEMEEIRKIVERQPHEETKVSPI